MIPVLEMRFTVTCLDFFLTSNRYKKNKTKKKDKSMQIRRLILSHIYCSINHNPIREDSYH